MQNISDINSNADILLQNGCIELSLDILKKFSKNESIIIYMFKFLQNISETNEDYRKNCLIKNCANIIQEIIDINDTKENVKIAGVKSKASIELENQEKLPEADEILGMIFKFKLGQRKSPIRTDIKNFLLAGRICKL